jgi:site-specific recombinase XerD
MEQMKPPKLPEIPPPILTDQDVKALIRACRGSGLAAKRDRAIIRLLFTNGLRREELARLTTKDVHMSTGRAYIKGKGNKYRYVPIGLKAITSLKDYTQARDRTRYAEHPQLWIGHRGPMTGNGIYQALRRRARRAGIDNVFAHRFRHTWAHNWLSAGGSEADAMVIGGWTSREMLDRYGKSASTERAMRAHQRLAIGEDI